MSSKLKTRRSAAKRFRFTGTGKVVRNQAFHRHNLTGQPKSAKLRQRKRALVAAADVKLVRRLLPYGG
jgi:large subunit ribosomal protein L35